jgi:hypothetical protein
LPGLEAHNEYNSDEQVLALTEEIMNLGAGQIAEIQLHTGYVYCRDENGNMTTALCESAEVAWQIDPEASEQLLQAMAWRGRGSYNFYTTGSPIDFLHLDYEANWDCTPTPECAAAGGVLCTDHTCTVCPAGTQPVELAGGESDAQRCGSMGWCCEPALDTSCARRSNMTCLPGDEPPMMECGHCNTDLTCPEGRVCCSANCCGG